MFFYHSGNASKPGVVIMMHARAKCGGCLRKRAAPFVSTKLSTFSGYIVRMRQYADAPMKTRLFHTEQGTVELEAAVEKELREWDTKGGSAAFNREDIGRLPEAEG